MSRVDVTLSKPIAIGNAQANALSIEPDFRTGWLRNAPPTPDWLLALIRSLIATFVTTSEADLAKLDDAKIVEAIPTPTGPDLDKAIPWLLHIVEKASGQPAEVIDQLAVVDLFAILAKLMPSMGALPSFRPTPAPGAATSPGSSTGPQAT